MCVLDDGSTENFQRSNSENLPSDGSDLTANNYGSSESDSSFDEEMASETEDGESPEGVASSSKQKRSQSIKARKSFSFIVTNMIDCRCTLNLPPSNCLRFALGAGADEGMP